jgi:hypothetical protein
MTLCQKFRLLCNRIYGQPAKYSKFFFNEIIVEDDIFEMSGTMGTSHKPEIKIIVKPKHWENLARKLKVTT